MNLNLCRLNLLIKAIHTSSSCQSVIQDKGRQTRILGKLLTGKKSSSKKRWYENAEVVSTSSFISSKKAGKNTSRRVNVLNKLFMKNITDLLATGEVSEDILGKQLQISKVKVTADFQGINVYWIPKGTLEDNEIEESLNKCSGILRHELSQLRLMGEVPKLKFVKDKMNANLIAVENVLKKCDFGDDFEKANDDVLLEFAGNNNDNGSSCIEPLLSMRQDVFGLDHSKIMNKILLRMKKSKQAWDSYKDSRCVAVDLDTKQSAMDDVQTKLEAAKQKDEFEKFLKRRSQKKNTPTRKKNIKLIENAKAPLDEHDCDDSPEDDFIEEYENK